MIILLTILNSISILYLFYKKANFYITFRQEVTFLEKTLVAYRITLWRKSSDFSSTGIYTIVIPVRNKKKVELKEEVNRMIANYSQQNKIQALRAKISWLNTWDELIEFEKNYSVVDEDLVKKLVNEFAIKNNIKPHKNVR